MPPTRRALLRNAAVFGGLAGLAGCIADQSPAGDAGTGSDQPTNRETTEPRTTRETPTERTTNGTVPEETTLTERPTVPTDTPADPSSTGKTPSEPTVTPPPNETVRSVGDLRVSVTNTIARKAVAYESVLGSDGVLARPDRQFVVAAVRSASGGTFDAAAPPERDAFSLIADDEAFQTVTTGDRTAGGYTTSLAGRGKIAYGGSNARGWTVGWVAFEPPSPLDAEEVSIRCRHGDETATWALPSGAVETLARQEPKFELGSFTVEPTDDGVELALVAENVSAVGGEFLAAVYWPTPGVADDDESRIVRQQVVPSERIEWSKRVEKPYRTPEDGSITARVDGVVEAERNVEVGTRTQI